MGKTSIEWTEHSANPIRFRLKDTGKTVHFCVKHSSGCGHCYAETMSRRWRAPEFIAHNLSKVECFLDEGVLQSILRRRKPTTYFLCDMTDWMGNWVPDEFIDRMLAALAMSPQHTFQLLTKRAERLERYFADPDVEMRILDCLIPLVGKQGEFKGQGRTNWMDGHERLLPLPNVWLGVSCENQATADDRIPHLIKTPAAVRFVSAEPLLGPIDLARSLALANYGRITAIGQVYIWLDWVIIGGESGRQARRCDMAWIRALLDQCQSAGTAAFLKQLGSKCTLTGKYDKRDGVFRVVPFYSDGAPGLPPSGDVAGFRVVTEHSKGGDWSEWPEDLRIRQMPALEAVR